MGGSLACKPYEVDFKERYLSCVINAMMDGSVEKNIIVIPAGNSFLANFSSEDSSIALRKRNVRCLSASGQPATEVRSVFDAPECHPVAIKAQFYFLAASSFATRACSCCTSFTSCRVVAA